MEEVYAALSGLNGGKASGLDGFPIAFWHFSWDFVEEEVMGFFKDFFDQNKFVRNLNSTFLVLINKKENVVDIKDYLLAWWAVYTKSWRRCLLIG